MDSTDVFAGLFRVVSIMYVGDGADVSVFIVEDVWFSIRVNFIWVSYDESNYEIIFMSHESSPVGL